MNVNRKKSILLKNEVMYNDTKQMMNKITSIIQNKTKSHKEASILTTSTFNHSW